MTRTYKTATLAAASGLMALAGFAWADAADAPDAVAATAIGVSGDVRLQTGQDSSVVQEGEVFTEGDRLVTGDRSSLHLVLADGSSVALGQDSELSLDETGSGANGSVTLLTLARGLLDAMVQKLKLGSSFEISTPYAVAAVKGTDFEVSDSAGASSVTVNQGVVRFGDPGRRRVEALRPMQRGSLDRQGFLAERPLNREEQRAFLRRWSGARALHARRWMVLRRLRRMPSHRRFLRQMLKRRAARARQRKGSARHPGWRRRGRRATRRRPAARP